MLQWYDTTELVETDFKQLASNLLSLRRLRSRLFTVIGECLADVKEESAAEVRRERFAFELIAQEIRPGVGWCGAPF